MWLIGVTLHSIGLRSSTDKKYYNQIIRIEGVRPLERRIDKRLKLENFGIVVCNSISCWLKSLITLWLLGVNLHLIGLLASRDRKERNRIIRIEGRGALELRITRGPWVELLRGGCWVSHLQRRTI